MAISCTPDQFRKAHGDLGRWSAVDFEVFEHLIQFQAVTSPVRSPDPDRPPSDTGAAGDSTTRSC